MELMAEKRSDVAAIGGALVTKHNGRSAGDGVNGPWTVRESQPNHGW